MVVPQSFSPKSHEIASPAFFQTLGIEIVHGLALTNEDTTEGRPVVILSEAAARLAWPNKDAVGERMRIAGTWATVIGVAADTRYRELTNHAVQADRGPQRADAGKRAEQSGGHT